jgi:cardiolipin synthase
VVPILYLLVHERFGFALVLFAATGASDGVDGWLARHYGWRSRLGGLLDPIADKVLLVACFLVLGVMGELPLWLALAVIFRDIVILTGGVLYHSLIEDVQPAPTLISKLNTLVQIVLPVPERLIETLIWSCLATTVASGALYVLVWGQMARGKGLRQD